MVLTRREALLSAAALAQGAQLPQVGFGPHRVSRLIVGGNPVSGHSHWNPALDREMMDYFSAANVKKMLAQCEAAGINVWQSRGDRHIVRLLREYRNDGGRIQWIAQTASELADPFRNIREIAAAGAIGIYIHGNRTDAAWRSGRIEELRDWLKAMRDAGVRAGVGSHIPEVFDYVESKNWGADFYMTCLYNLTRPKEEVAKLSPSYTSGEFFHDPDRARMLQRVRQARTQCLIFKIYGATRKCGSESQMREAVGEALAAAKPQDCIVIGMFPKHSDQVTQNVRLVRDSIAAAQT
jgi:hypothetical protein